MNDQTALLLLSVYRSRKRDEMYLYVPKAPASASCPRRCSPFSARPNT